METTEYKVNYGFTSETFPLGTHMCYIYDDEAERKMVIEKFLESGFSAREKVGAFADMETEDEIKDYFKEMGLSVDEYRKTGQLVAGSEKKAYCPDGRFDVERMLESWKKFYNLGKSEGYAAVRATGNPHWLHKGAPGAERWVEYESRLNDLVLEYPFSGILCTYDSRKCSGTLLYDVLSVHNLMVVRGQVVRNPYYISPEELRLKQGA
ncbi:MAG: MEDS domain-containing protein [Nitrospirae bacterium]|nr:MEDS domain-containing protein [Nitrospirota bacterium]